MCFGQAVVGCCPVFIWVSVPLFFLTLGNAVSFFLREMPSDTGAVRDDAVSSSSAHSIRGASTFSVFLLAGRSSRRWSPQLGSYLQLLFTLYFTVLFCFFGGICSLCPFVPVGAVVNPT